MAYLKEGSDVGNPVEKALVRPALWEGGAGAGGREGIAWGSEQLR